MSKEEIIQAIQRCARKLRRNPNLRELHAMAGVPAKVVWKKFGGIGKALEASGLKASGSGFTESEETLLLDWAKAARNLKKVPSVSEYKKTGRFSHKPFHNRFGSWMRVGEAFRAFTKRNRLGREWRDVLETIGRENRHGGEEERAVRPRGGLLCDRPVYGRPLQMAEMAYAPTNEMGVIFLFGAVARRLGFKIQRMQTGYPDCIAMREMRPGQWQRVRIEIEYESRNFFKHRHQREKCDFIVCWRHNWKECPEEIRVVELSSMVD